MVPSASSAEHAATANEILTRARSLREVAAAESTEADRRLSELVLELKLCTERVENATRLLALADSCVGKIRSRMRAHSLPIHPPSISPTPITASDVNGPPVQGAVFHHIDDLILTQLLDEQLESA
jgi:hypothetical protein